MLRIDREAHAQITATPERCRELLTDAAAYPRWSSLITNVEPIGEGRVRMRAELLGIGFEMNCELEAVGERVILRRLPYDEHDEERFEAAFTIGPGAITLHVTAAIDAPGPARLIKGRVERRLADDLLDDFTRAL